MVSWGASNSLSPCSGISVTAFGPFQGRAKEPASVALLVFLNSPSRHMRIAWPFPYASAMQKYADYSDK